MQNKYNNPPIIKTGSLRKMKNYPTHRRRKRITFELKKENSNEALLDISKKIINVLNMKGYEQIKSTSGTGLITASLPEEDLSDSAAARTISSIASAFTFGIVGNDDKTAKRNTDITVIVNSLNSSLQKIRITFKETTTTETQNWVGSTKRIISDLTDRPQAYEDIFNEIQSQLNIVKK